MTTSAERISWITPAGNLGTIPEGIFFQVPILAEVPAGATVYYIMIAGSLPDGIQCRKTGLIEGTPKAIASLQGVPQEVARDVTSTFAVRAYTEIVVNGQEVIDQVIDRTFSLTVTGNDIPDFITPPGLIGTYYDGTEVVIPIEFTDRDPNETLKISVLSGALPPGLTLSNTGIISGLIEPIVGPPGTATAGYDDTSKDQYPNDFTTRATSQNFQFTIEITDGKEANVRTFQIYVYAKNSMTADTIDFRADNTFITADTLPSRTPILVTPTGDLGRVRADNYFSYKFDAIDFDGDAIEYSITVGAGIGYDSEGFDNSNAGFDRGSFSLPPGLSIDPDTGWFYGYIPDQGATERTYRFAIRVFKKNTPTLISDFYYFTITIIGNIDTEVTWLTQPNLGTINNGAVSYFSVAAVNVGGRALQYRLLSGSDSKLPQGLRLLSSGNIVGKVSFNTFALDNGTTTFDKLLTTRLDINETTFDLEFNFTVNAFASQTQQIEYQVSSIVISNGGSGYVSQPTVTISPPPQTAGSIQATTGLVTIQDGVITAINLGNPGIGYQAPPTITITGGGGAGATAVAQIVQAQQINAVSVLRRFTITVNRVFNEPYETLYIKAMPPTNDRVIITQLLQDQQLIPVTDLYRADDVNFGIAQNIRYDHAYGLTASSLENYVSALDLNHYWKNLTLGKIKLAQALDADGNILYEVIYSEVIDNLVNNQGQSVSKSVKLPYPVLNDNQVETTVVYPNSLVDMRNQVIDTVGQVSPALPLWMTSKQTDGSVLGFTPAWVIAYIQPGKGEKILYNINRRFGTELNKIDFKVDRYELDKTMTFAYTPYEDSSAQGFWVPPPPVATTFDETLPIPTIFDGSSTDFITPSNTTTTSDVFDKYLVFPKTNILG